VLWKGVAASKIMNTSGILRCHALYLVMHSKLGFYNNEYLCSKVYNPSQEWNLFIQESQDSSVSIATGYKLDSEGWIPGRV
jgi:hypothetical protein